MIRADWIALDWGTTNLRVWAMAQDGAVLDSARSGLGMDRLAQDPRQFESTLLPLIDQWLASGRKTDVVACGMAGSRQGWAEAPYRPTPAPARAANAMTPAPCQDPRLRVHIAAGVCQESPPDVMRGEETAIAGLLRFMPDFDGTAILPGTHNKWARVGGGHILGFTSFLTGELYGLLTESSILRHSVALDGFDAEAFAQGFADTVHRPETAFTQLFALRAAHLLHGPNPVAAANRLSGCLAGLEFAGAESYRNVRDVVVIASGTVAEQYRIVLDHERIPFQILDPENCVLDGLREARNALPHCGGEAKFET